MLQDILADEDQEALRWWCKRAKLSRLDPFRELAASIRQHWSGVAAFLKTRLTNGAIEAVNGLLQLAKRLARGFRSLRCFRIMAYLKALVFTSTCSLKPSPVTPVKIANGLCSVAPQAPDSLLEGPRLATSGSFRPIA